VGLIKRLIRWAIREDLERLEQLARHDHACVTESLEEEVEQLKHDLNERFLCRLDNIVRAIQELGNTSRLTNAVDKAVERVEERRDTSCGPTFVIPPSPARPAPVVKKSRKRVQQKRVAGSVGPVARPVLGNRSEDAGQEAASNPGKAPQGN
jgi:hypothetical protein